MSTAEGRPNSATRSAEARSSAPYVASALSGFVIGVVVTLAVTGFMNQGNTKQLPAATAAPVVSRDQPHLFKSISRLIVKQLGPSYPNQREPRLQSLTLIPPESRADRAHLQFHDVVVVFRLNDHPLGKTWRLAAAKGDVFRVLKALYTSGLPISSVQLNGTFPLSGKSRTYHQYAVITFISRTTAAHIAWRKLDRTREGVLWRRLNRVQVDPRFG